MAVVVQFGSGADRCAGGFLLRPRGSEAARGSAIVRRCSAGMDQRHGPAGVHIRAVQPDVLRPVRLSAGASDGAHGRHVPRCRLAQRLGQCGQHQRQPRRRLAAGERDRARCADPLCQRDHGRSRARNLPRTVPATDDLPAVPAFLGRGRPDSGNVAGIGAAGGQESTRCLSWSVSSCREAILASSQARCWWGG